MNAISGNEAIKRTLASLSRVADFHFVIWVHGDVPFRLIPVMNCEDAETICREIVHSSDWDEMDQLGIFDGAEFGEDGGSENLLPQSSVVEWMEEAEELRKYAGETRDPDMPPEDLEDVEWIDRIDREDAKEARPRERVVKVVGETIDETVDEIEPPATPPMGGGPTCSDCKQPIEDSNMVTIGDDVLCWNCYGRGSTRATPKECRVCRELTESYYSDDDGAICVDCRIDEKDARRQTPVKEVKEAKPAPTPTPEPASKPIIEVSRPGE